MPRILPPTSYIAVNNDYPLRVFPVNGYLSLSNNATSVFVETDITVTYPSIIEGQSFALLIIQDKVGHKVKLSDEFIILSGTIKETPSTITLINGITIDGKIYCNLWNKI